jgi:hypothetical protein
MFRANVLQKNSVGIRSALGLLPRRCWYCQHTNKVVRFPFEKKPVYSEFDIFDLDEFF